MSDAQQQRLAVSLILTVLVLALLLFLPAGRLDWSGGWLFLVVTCAVMLVAIAFLARANPDIFEARRRIHRGTKRWDLVLLAVLLPAMVAIIPVAALDVRYGWSAAPWWVVALGYALFLAGFAGMTWAQAVNRFFEPGVRIQTDRGHHVIDHGPYAIVRHPGYTAAILLIAGMALALGSFWALVPAAISILALIVRTAWEDETLSRELPGYAAYVQRVRHRLVPAIW